MKYAAALLMLLCAMPSLAAERESAYDRVMRTGTIRCGYIVYPPNTMKDPNTGVMSGISPAIMEKVAEGLGLKVEWVEETGTASVTEALRTERFDMLCTAGWANMPRARYVAYSRPIYYVGVGALSQAGNIAFDNNIEAADNPATRISNVDGSTYAVIAKRKFPQATVHSHPELTDLTHPLLDVGAGKADLAFAEEYVLNEYIKNNPGKGHKVVLKEPIQVFHTSFYYNMRDAELRHMIDNALNFLIENGEIDDILNQYEAKYPGSYGRAIQAYEVQK